MSTKDGKGKKPGGEWSGDGWKVRGPKLGLRHVALLKTGRWMGQRANTRVPAALMIIGYPASLVLVLFSPFVVLGVGMLGALVLWHVSYRSVVRPNENASKSKLSVAADWATRVTSLVPAYLLWLMLVRWHISSASDGASGIESAVRRVRALFGTIFDGRWFLGYCTASVLSWLLIFRAPHVVTKHNERRSAEASPLRGIEDFNGAKILKRTTTRVGERIRINVVGTGKTASDFINQKMKEKIAARRGLPASRVLVEPVTANAGQIEVSIRDKDPWKDALVHPRQAEGFAQERTSITKPIPLGLEPEDGTGMSLQLVTKEGGQHVVVIAGTRAGKTTLINSVIEYLTRSPWDQRDTDVVLIDVTKGKDGRAWAPAVAESYMGPESFEAALNTLDRYCDLIAERARINRRAVWKVGRRPEQRAKVIIIDEASALLACPNQAIAARAKAAVGFIMGKGASELVILVVISQRGVLAHLGTNDISTQSFVKIALGVSKPGEMNYVIPGWADQGMPDMSKYGEGRKGIALVYPVAQPWCAGRTWDLSNLDTIRSIAADRVIKDRVHLAILEAERGTGVKTPAPADLVTEPPADGIDDPDTETSIFDADPDPVAEVSPARDPEGRSSDPDDPDNVPGAPWGSPAPEPRRGDPVIPGVPRELTARERALMAWGRPSGKAGYRPTSGASAVKAVENLQDAAEAAVRTADAALRVEMSRSADESAHRWATRALATAKADQAETVPEDFVTLVLGLITTEGSASRARVCQVSGLQKTTVAERLRIMTNQGALTRQGSGRGTSYVVRVPEPDEIAQ